MKNKLSFIIIVLTGSLLCTTCDLLKNAIKDVVKEPEVTLKSVDFSEINLEGLTLLSTLNVTNDNSFDIPLPNFDWDLSIIENPFISGVIESSGSLKSQETTEVSFPVSFKYTQLINALTALKENEDNALYKLGMVAHIPVPKLGELSFPFEDEGKIPIMHLPEIAIASAPKAEITYGDNIIPGIPNPIGATAIISLALSVKNNSNVAVMVKNLSYDFMINNISLSNGGVSNESRINSGETETIPFNFQLNAADVIKVGLPILQGNFSYNFTGNYKFGLPDFPIFNEVSDSFNLK